MNSSMVRIELGGILGKIFSKVHYRSISRIGEAGVALAKKIPEFEKFMVSSKQRGLTYSIFIGKKNIGVDDLGFPVTTEAIRIIPIIIGSKKSGIFQTILGAVLVGGALWNPAFLGMSASFSSGLMSYFRQTHGIELHDYRVDYP